MSIGSRGLWFSPRLCGRTQGSRLPKPALSHQCKCHVRRNKPCVHSSFSSSPPFPFTPLLSPLSLAGTVGTDSLPVAKSCTHFALNVQYLCAPHFVCLQERSDHNSIVWLVGSRSSFSACFCT